MNVAHTLKLCGTGFAAGLGGIPIAAAFFLVVYGVLELLIPWQTAAWITLALAIGVWGGGVWFSWKFLRRRVNE